LTARAATPKLDVGSVERALRAASAASEHETFSEAERRGLPEPVRRYLATAVADGTPLAHSARLTMRGHIKVGRWLPFRAHEVLAPHRGFLWQARAAGLIGGYDCYLDGRGVTEWKLAGLVRVAQGDGPDVSRAAAARAGGEAIWLPTTLLPRFGVTWTASDDAHITAHFEVDGHPLDLHLEIDARGLVVSLWFDRWHQVDDEGGWGMVPCGGEITASRTFGGLTIPSAGTFGWFYGTDRWPEGQFFRYEITDLDVDAG
jgi:hypothetical protein